MQIHHGLAHLNSNVYLVRIEVYATKEIHINFIMHVHAENHNTLFVLPNIWS